MLSHAQSGNQKQRPNPSSNITTDELISPVTAADLAYFLGMDSPDVNETALLESVLLVACEQFIAFANHELLSRIYTLRFDRHPERQPGYSGLGPSPALLDWWIDLPLTPVTSITEVRMADEIITDYESDLDSVPARIRLNRLANGNIEIDYATGYLTAAEIPASILHGIKTLAAYLFEHRGECDATQAIVKSGAGSVWISYKTFMGGI